MKTNLKLALVKDVDKLLGDELVEAEEERLELVLDTLLDAPLGDEPGGRESVQRTQVHTGQDALDVFLLVLVRNGYVLPSRLEVNSDRLAEPVVLGREGVLKYVRDVVVARYPRRSAADLSAGSERAHSIQVRERKTSASTLSMSTSVIFFLSTILYKAVMK